MNLKIDHTFFEVIGKSPALYRVLWFEWLGSYVDKVTDSDFCDNYQCPIKGVTREQVREIWLTGIEHLGNLNLSAPPKKEANDSDILFASEVIDYLNLKAGTTYSKNGKKNIELILARKKDGFQLSDFKIVIDKKSEQWKGTDMEKYLRPITLFSNTKFENYINEPISGNRKKSAIDNLRESVDKAKEHFGLR